MTARRREPLRAAPAPAPLDADDAPEAMPRPELTITEAAQAVGKSRRTVRRWLDAGRLEGARMEDTPNGPVWRIPAAALAATGHQLYAPSGPDPEPDDDDDQADELDQLREERDQLRDDRDEWRRRAEVAEARAELLERIAAERAEHLADLRAVVAPLEAAPQDRRPRWWQRG